MQLASANNHRHWGLVRGNEPSTHSPDNASSRVVALWEPVSPSEDIGSTRSRGVWSLTEDRFKTTLEGLGETVPRSCLPGTTTTTHKVTNLIELRRFGTLT